MHHLRSLSSWTILLAIALSAGSCGRGPVAVAVPARSAGTLSGNELVSERVVATLAPDASPQELATAYEATLIDWEADERTAAFLPPQGTSPPDFATVLAADPRVETCEEDGFLEPSESRQQSFSFDDGLGSELTYAEQPAALSLDLAGAHRVSLGYAVRVAVLDTGIDPNHRDLRSHLDPGYDFISGDADPTDVVNGIDDDADGHTDEAYGHGTHVAGIIALVAPGARIMPVRVLDADGRGNVLSVAAGVRWAVANGANVINMSLGTLKDSDGIHDAIEEAEYGGCVVVSSAGNWGAPEPEEFPARSSHASAVGAVHATAQPAAFTSYGDFVAVSAPGIGVRSTFPGDGYRLWSGTSMSAPFVAGVAALLKSLHPAWDMEQVMTRISASARPIVGGTSAQREGLGAGVVDAGAALAPDAAAQHGSGTESDPPLPIRRPHR